MREDGEGLSYEPSSAARGSRATALGRGTHGVADVRQLVETQFKVAFPRRVWVAGRVGPAAAPEDGDLRFPLLSSGVAEPFRLPCVVPAGTLPALRELLERGQDADLDDVVREGRLARVGGLLRFEPSRGTVALVVSELDSTPTAVGLDEERELALTNVGSRGLLERQRERGCPRAPRRVAVVGDERDAAPARVEQQLASSPYGVRVQRLDVGLTTTEAPRRLAEAVREAARTSDLVLLVKDEGRPLRLAGYDAFEVAQAVADAPVPVVAGLGGRGRRTAADEVAYASVPTAQAAGDWLLRRLYDAERALHELGADVEREVAAGFTRARQALEDARTEVGAAGQQAQERAEAAARTRRLLLYGGCALPALVVVLVALLTSHPLLLLALLVPVAVLVGERVWASRARTTGSRRMTQREDDFAAVLERLRGVREELAGTSSPDKVAGLRDLGQQLVAQGERLLGLLESAPAAAAAALAAGAATARDGEEPAVGSVGAPLVPVAAPSAPPSLSGSAGGGSAEPTAARSEDEQVLAVHPGRRDAGATQPVDAPTAPVDAPTQVLRTPGAPERPGS